MDSQLDGLLLSTHIVTLQTLISVSQNGQSKALAGREKIASRRTLYLEVDRERALIIRCRSTQV